MSGKVNKRLRRAAEKVAGGEHMTVVAVNKKTGEARSVDLYRAYKKVHGRLPWKMREKHHPFDAYPTPKNE